MRYLSVKIETFTHTLIRSLFTKKILDCKNNFNKAAVLISNQSVGTVTDLMKAWRWA